MRALAAGAGLLLALGLCCCARPAAAAADCPVTYSSGSGSSGRPLLLGGYMDRCAAGCQPRDSMWAREVCRADPEALSAINVCEAWQVAALEKVVRQYDSGAMTEFSPCQLWPYLRNRTLWVVGDSHSKGFFAALRCLFIDFFSNDQPECAASSNIEQQQALELASLRGHIYNSQPRCVLLRDSARICLVHSPMGNLLASNDTKAPGTLQVLQSLASPTDVFYISFARWHYNNCEGVSESYLPSLEAVGKFLQETRGAFPNAFFVVPPHDHSKCLKDAPTVAFDSTLQYCPPASSNQSRIFDTVAGMANDVMGRFGVRVIDSHALSTALYFGHTNPRQSITGKIDCLHMCRPGMPEIDAWFMLNAFVEAGLSKLEGPLPAGARLLPPYQCAFVESSLFKPKPISDPPTPPDASISIVLPSARPRQPPARASQQAAGPAAAPAPAVAAAPAAATGRWSKQAAAARGGGSRGQRLPGEDESVPAAADVAAVGLAGLAGDELMFTAHAGMGSAADGFVAVSASTAGVPASELVIMPDAGIRDTQF